MPAQVVIETDGPSQKKRAKRLGIQRSLAEKNTKFFPAQLVMGQEIRLGEI